ncbi:MAG TPA: hypothetical protein PLT82_05845 [Candidatus Hydrogenedens sp.]|mgnify:CR=1 FL=1|nr:hypothetical protein [Candidatus Hydrogenedens sp.]HOK08168.1 hypothetical protein [Candidatus Hydrogenedens sp.]HPP58637.1 hypothetical protein [Candidatus Hydrogenedens sp.]
MSITKVRETIAAIAAILLVLIMAGVGATMAGWNVPVISNIVKMIMGK